MNQILEMDSSVFFGADETQEGRSVLRIESVYRTQGRTEWSRKPEGRASPSTRALGGGRKGRACRSRQLRLKSRPLRAAP